jgi:hypothetical protein
MQQPYAFVGTPGPANDPLRRIGPKERDVKYPVWKQELTEFPHKMFNEPLEQLVEFYKEHITRDVNSARLRPAGFWLVARLFLISAMQTYAAICILLVDNRPKRLMLQAGILNRSLLETLGNLMALCQAPQSRTRILERELFKNQAVTLRRYRKSFGNDEKWQEISTRVRTRSRGCIKKRRNLASLYQEPGTHS